MNKGGIELYAKIQGNTAIWDSKLSLM
jgi:hypothetical protein